MTRTGHKHKEELSHERAALAVVLTAVAGAVDALSITALGHVFTGIMTGNLVLLGVAAGQGLGAEASRSAVAFAGFAAGLFAGYQLAHPAAAVARWLRASVPLAFALELLLVTAFFAVWIGTGGHPSGGRLFALICLSAVAMGVQSATATRLAVSGISTTYVTGTLNALMGSLALVGRPGADAISQAAALMALCGGAAIAMVVYRAEPVVAPVVPLAILTAAVLLASRSKDMP
jgi:uncharacterized membrane protein YoaK (UPF0700 family)